MYAPNFRAIIQSGTASQIAHIADGTVERSSNKLVEAVGCAAGSETLACLQGKDWKDIITHTLPKFNMLDMFQMAEAINTMVTKLTSHISLFKLLNIFYLFVQSGELLL